MKFKFLLPYQLVFCFDLKKRRKVFSILSFIFICSSFDCIGQISFAGFEHLFTRPKGYIVSFTDQPPLIDGSLHDQAWKAANWTDNFIDIEGTAKPKPSFNTRAKMLWNDSCLFIAAELEDPHIWATLKKRDNIIYHDNDFEVFINPGNNTHQYFEIEVNALNTILDLFMAKPYRNGTGAMISYNVCGLRSAVKIHGSLNNARDKDSSWTVEMAIPFSALYIGNQWKAPGEGSLWRINFSRVQWDVDIKNGKYFKRKDDKNKYLPEHNWVWSPQGVINMHFPERWGYMQFTRKNENNPDFILPYDEKRRPYLWLMYYKQKEYYRRNGKFAASFKELKIDSLHITIDEKTNQLKMEATSRQFTVYIIDGNSTLYINEEGLVQSLNKAI